jgi:tRNA nucleotidyltransferase (CCA-adding enzyme)
VAKGSWKSIADRSPFHTEYVKINLDDCKRKQVRLLKKFLKSAGIYGSEIATNGFSGYVAEVLILKYGSVESVMWAFSEMSKEKNVISIDIVAEDILKTFQSDVIIMDPIDPKRNLGTAISAESLGKFILTARAFLERPSTEFFIVREKDLVKPYTKLDSNLLIVEFTYQKRSPDIIWGQMKRSLNAISQQLELAGFTVIRSTCITDEKKSAAFVFLLESILLPFYTEKKGPAVFRKTDSASFITKNSKNNLPIWIAKDMRITTLVQRKIISAKDYTMVLLTERLERSGVTKGLRQDILLHGHIYTGTELKLKGIVKDAANELLATEPLIFQ